MYKDCTSSMLRTVSQVIDPPRRRLLESEKDEPFKNFHDEDLSVDKTLPSYMYTQYPALYPANKLYPILSHLSILRNKSLLGWNTFNNDHEEFFKR